MNIKIINGIPVRVTQEMITKEEPLEHWAADYRIERVADLVEVLITLDIPHVVHTPGTPTMGRGGLRELWRVLLYVPEKVVLEANTEVGVVAQFYAKVTSDPEPVVTISKTVKREQAVQG